MFLLAVKIMPGAEKVQGEVLLSEENQLFFTCQESKNSFFRGKQIVTKIFNRFTIMRMVSLRPMYDMRPHKKGQQALHVYGIANFVA